MMGNSSDIDISIPSLFSAWSLFRSGKRASRAIDEFEYDLESQLFSLAQDLRTGRYEHGEYQHFVVNDSKRRDIAVATVRDRVVHRLVYEHLVSQVNAQFLYHVWSCRKGKGLLGAIAATENAMRRYKDAVIWRGDIRRFFDSIDHEIISGCIRDRASGNQLYGLCDEIIASYESTPGKGLAIGNLTSQILGNLYLHEFDRFVTHSIKPLSYVRYGDDFILWMDSMAASENAATEGAAFLRERLVLELQPSHSLIQPAHKKLHYLGLYFYGQQSALDAHMRIRLQHNVTMTNAASYEALLRHHMPVRYVRRYAWQQAERYFLLY